MNEHGVPDPEERTEFWKKVEGGFAIATIDDLAAAGWAKSVDLTIEGRKHFPDHQAGETTYALAVRTSGPSTPLRLLAAWPEVCAKFGLMSRAEAESTIEWLIERLTPQAKAEIQAAVKLAERFPKLVPGSR